MNTTGDKDAPTHIEHNRLRLLGALQITLTN